MLRIFHHPGNLDFCKLNAVYAQSNAQSAKMIYPLEEPRLAYLQAEYDFERYVRDEFFHVSGAFYAVWEESEAYICALRMEPYLEGYLLTSLETHPDYRRRGYATELILAVADFVSRPVYAHIYKDNHISMATHSKCGFCQILDYAKLLDGTVTQRACTMRLR